VIAPGFSPRRIVGMLAVSGLFAVSALAVAAESSKNAEATGAALFRDKGCAYCHGANTQGTQKGPSLLHIRKAMNAGQISNQIKNGGQKMPSFEEALSPEEINQLVAYLRAKHRPSPTPVAAESPRSSAAPTQ
jgi:mono/diheme cytochrome c family protein